MGAIDEFSIVGINKCVEMFRGYHRGIGCGNIIFNHQNIKTGLRQEINLFQIIFRYHIGNLMDKIRIFIQLEHQVFHADQSPAANKCASHQPEKCNISL